MLLILSVAIALCGAVTYALDCEPGAVHFDRSGMGLNTFPDLTQCAHTLETLYLSNTAITEIPASIGNLTALRELRVDGLQLQSLPDEIGNLASLRQLWAGSNYLSHLPESFAELAQLEVAYLSYNQFSEVPSLLLSLPNLHFLNLESNRITTLPVQLSLSNIREARFGYNPLSFVPPELGNWHQLQTFYVYGSEVSCLPKSMKRLPSFVEGNYLPTCTNNTVAGYVVQRARKHGTCGGPVRNVTGFATGCIDQVRITCEEQDGQIVITRDRLSILDSRSLTCQSDAPIVSTSRAAYPRCEEASGVATSCADLDSATEVPFPHRHPGMVTLDFEDYESCDRKARNMDFGRRLTATAETTEAELQEVAMDFGARTGDAGMKAKTVKPRDHYRPRPDMAAFNAAMEAKRKSEQTARELESRRSALAARAGKHATLEDVFTCDPSTVSAILYSGGGVRNYDLRNCTALRDLTIYYYTPDVLAEQIPYLPVLASLKLMNNVPMGLPANLHLLSSLTSLEVDVWETAMPEVLRSMTQLTHLLYTSWGYSQFIVPDWIVELTSLRSLDLSGNHFYDQFPHAVTQMVNLRNLSLSNAQMWGRLPESLTNLVNLYSLDLSYNWLGSVPAFLGRMTGLRVLGLTATGLTSVPETIGNLVNLNSISVNENYFSCLPEKVRDLGARNPAGLWNLLDYPACPPVPLPLSFVHQRNSACLWDPYYEFWYRAACDNSADTLSVTLYADSACRKKAKRAAVHGLQQQFPGLGYCMPQSRGFNNGTAPSTYSVQYCHN